MTLTSTLTVIAIVLGPILAVQIQKFLERATVKKRAKLQIFKTLMSTRGLSMAPLHVQALNMIDVEFGRPLILGRSNKKERPVVDAWKTYMEHLYKCPQNTKDANYEHDLKGWTENARHLLIELLFEMSKALEFDFDKVLLERQAYTPRGYHDDQSFRLFMQYQLASLFSGKSSLSVRIENLPGELEKVYLPETPPPPT